MQLVDITGKHTWWIPLFLAVSAGAGCAVLGWLIVPEWQLTTAVVAFLAGFTFVLLSVVLLASFFGSLMSSVHHQMHQIMNRIYQSEQELRSMINIRPLLEDSLTGFGGWAVDARFAEQLLLFIKEKHREPASTGMIVECGSGTSTVVAARYLKQTGFGEILSLEHDERFAVATRQDLRDAGLEDVATVLTAPLRQWDINGQTMPWYDIRPETFLQEKIDLLIVDGPPSKTGPLARYPAVPVLKKWLHPGSIIILDDGHRDDEKQTAERWASELGITPEFHPGGKGTWIIRNEPKQTITNEEYPMKKAKAVP